MLKTPNDIILELRAKFKERRKRGDYLTPLWL